MTQSHCQSLRSQLDYIKTLKHEFDKALKQAIVSGKREDIDKVKSIKAEIEEKMWELKESMEPREAREQKLQWQALYKEYFHIDIDPKKIRVPKRTKEQIEQGFTRLILVHESMTPSEIWKKCEELFDVSRIIPQSFDKNISERNPKDGSYIIWVKDIQNPEEDKDMKYETADDIKQQGITTETLQERLLHELKYFKETGKHLDMRGATLCAGSRFPDGDVPYVYCILDGVRINTCNSDVAPHYIRTRKVIS